MRCSRQRDAFRGRSETWRLSVHHGVMWKNTVLCSHLHALHFTLHKRTLKGSAYGEAKSECAVKCLLLWHVRTCPGTFQNTSVFWSQPWGVSTSRNRQLFHALLCSYTWYSPAVYLCVSLSPVHLWSHGLKLPHLRERREEDSSPERKGWNKLRLNF